MAPSREVLRRFGNMSSASIMFILRDLLDSAPSPGRALAFGPGLTVEVMDFTLLPARHRPVAQNAQPAMATA
jgi:predicted naringenin-chalcone synthase